MNIIQIFKMRFLETDETEKDHFASKMMDHKSGGFSTIIKLVKQLL